MGGEVGGLGNNRNRDMEVRNYSALFSEMQSHLAHKRNKVLGNGGLAKSHVKGP